MGFVAKAMLGLLPAGLLAGGVAGAQTSGSVPDAPAPAASAPCVPADASKTAAPGSKPCVTPSVSQQFPYPGEKPETPAAPDSGAAAGAAGSVKDKFPYPGEEKPAAPKPGSAGDKFPYPGETKDSPDAAPETPDFAPDPDAPPKKPKGESGSSSSSSSDDDAAPGDNPAAKEDDEKPGLKDEGSEGSTAHKRRLLRNRIPAQKPQTDDDRVAEDLSVAKFYQQSGNLNGAYMRVKDALKVQPNDPDVHLALAGVAEKLGKKDEAVAEYETYLKTDPDTDEAKKARKALEKLKP